MKLTRKNYNLKLNNMTIYATESCIDVTVGQVTIPAGSTPPAPELKPKVNIWEILADALRSAGGPMAPSINR